MRKVSILVILLICSLCISSTALSQRFLGAVAAGINLSRLDGDEADSGFGYNRIGANFGVAVILPFAKNWDFTIETNFSQKGAFQKENGANDYPFRYKLRLNYVEVPLLIHYNDKNRLKGGLGVSWGRLVSFNEIEADGFFRPYTDIQTFKSDDFCVVADLMVRVWQKLHVNLRWSYSLVPIRNRTFSYPPAVPPGSGSDKIDYDYWEREQRNNVITLRVVYIINEELENTSR